jgi:hypothetical protein
MRKTDIVKEELFPTLNVNVISDPLQMTNKPDLVEELSPRFQENLVNGIQCLESSKWLIMIPSCFLITLLSWDIVGDKMGWDGSYWIPLMGIGILLILRILDSYLIWNRGV